jgi:hypothetical protein
MNLKLGNFKWIQLLYYKNTTFRCWFFHQIGHLQETCPQARIHPKKEKGQAFKPKSWYPCESSLEEDGDDGCSKYMYIHGEEKDLNEGT